VKALNPDWQSKSEFASKPYAHTTELELFTEYNPTELELFTEYNPSQVALHDCPKAIKQYLVAFTVVSQARQM
jgi:hypothetical protein